MALINEASSLYGQIGNNQGDYISSDGNNLVIGGKSQVSIFNQDDSSQSQMKIEDEQSQMVTL